MNDESTLEDDSRPGDGALRGSAVTRPGLVVVFAGGAPCVRVLELGAVARVLGRGLAELASHRRVSRRHARVRYENGRFYIQDLGSRNGTYVDGRRCDGELAMGAPQVVRLGDVLLSPCRDVLPYASYGVIVENGRVRGPQSGSALSMIAVHAQAGMTLHVRGESGTGKEDAAREFHARGLRPSGPFVAVNCAAIPEGVAERLLFGAVRGAYSGAAQDAIGYLEAADGGTLFLDEVAELQLTVQAKLLRVLESREVLPLGASRPRPLNLRLCTATHQDLRRLVAAGRLRADLYYRICAPTVELPPLRERPADIPFLVANEGARAAPGIRVHASLVEACLLRPWPGNVRELLAAVRMAALAARTGGARRIDASHLDAITGTALPEASGAVAREVSQPASTEGIEQIRTAAIREALRKSRGNVTTTAKALGVHRTQLRRWLERYGIDPGRPE